MSLKTSWQHSGDLSTKGQKPKLVLASQSKYRAELLRQLKVEFITVNPDIDETPYLNEDPMLHVQRLAKEKALVKAEEYPQHLIIGADIVTLIDNKITGKPKDYAEAVKYLQQSSGNLINNLTGICVLDTQTGKFLLDVVATTVKFKQLSIDQIHRYVEIEQPYDNAGAFRIQSLGIALLESVQTTDPTAIVGLPLIRLTTMLAEFGYAVV